MQYITINIYYLINIIPRYKYQNCSDLEMINLKYNILLDFVRTFTFYFWNFYNFEKEKKNWLRMDFSKKKLLFVTLATHCIGSPDYSYNTIRGHRRRLWYRYDRRLTNEMTTTIPGIEMNIVVVIINRSIILYSFY